MNHDDDDDDDGILPLFPLSEDGYPIDASAKEVAPATTERLSRQEQAVLDALLATSLVSNVDLAQISLKYFTKISALRSRGYEIVKVSEDNATGIAWYQLVSPFPRLRTYRVLVEVRVPGLPARQCVFLIHAVSPLSARYRAWRAVKVIALEKPEEVLESELSPVQQVLDE